MKIKLGPTSGIFYEDQRLSPDPGQFVCQIIGVSSGPDPHVIVQFEDGLLSVRDLDSIGDAGEPIPCKGWGVVKTLRGEPNVNLQHALWPCRFITAIGFANLQDPRGHWHWIAPKAPRGRHGVDREYRLTVEGEETERVVSLEGFALTEGPSNYVDVYGDPVTTSLEWRVDLGPPEQYLPLDDSPSELVKVLETLPERSMSRPFPDGRKLPYELAQWWVSTLGMGRTDWAKFCSLRPSCIPAHPWKLYGRRWTGWGDWLGLTRIAARRAGITSIEQDFQNLPLQYRDLYLRFQKELDRCAEAMAPHLEYRR